MNQFFMASSLFNSGNVLAKTGRFSRNWPLARAKFASVFLMELKFLHPPSSGSFEKSSLRKKSALIFFPFLAYNLDR